MMLDYTDLAAGINLHLRPRNHLCVEGELYHGGQKIAVLSHLVLLTTHGALVGGRFTLAWHRHRGPLLRPLQIIASVSDDRMAQPTGMWRIDDVAIVDHGVATAIGSCNDLLARDVSFFGRNTTNPQDAFPYGPAEPRPGC